MKDERLERVQSLARGIIDDKVLSAGSEQRNRMMENVVDSAANLIGGVFFGMLDGAADHSERLTHDTTSGFDQVSGKFEDIKRPNGTF